MKHNNNSLKDFINQNQLIINLKKFFKKEKKVYSIKDALYFEKYDPIIEKYKRFKKKIKNSIYITGSLLTIGSIIGLGVLYYTNSLIFKKPEIQFTFSKEYTIEKNKKFNKKNQAIQKFYQSLNTLSTHEKKIENSQTSSFEGTLDEKIEGSKTNGSPESFRIFNSFNSLVDTIHYLRDLSDRDINAFEKEVFGITTEEIKKKRGLGHNGVVGTKGEMLIAARQNYLMEIITCEMVGLDFLIAATVSYTESKYIEGVVGGKNPKDIGIKQINEDTTARYLLKIITTPGSKYYRPEIALIKIKDPLDNNKTIELLEAKNFIDDPRSKIHKTLPSMYHVNFVLGNTLLKIIIESEKFKSTYSNFENKIKKNPLILDQYVNRHKTDKISFRGTLLPNPMPKVNDEITPHKYFKMILLYAYYNLGAGTFNYWYLQEFEGVNIFDKEIDEYDKEILDFKVAEYERKLLEDNFKNKKSNIISPDALDFIEKEYKLITKTPYNQRSNFINDILSPEEISKRNKYISDLKKLVGKVESCQGNLPRIINNYYTLLSFYHEREIDKKKFPNAATSLKNNKLPEGYFTLKPKYQKKVDDVRNLIQQYKIHKNNRKK